MLPVRLFQAARPLPHGRHTRASRRQQRGEPPRLGLKPIITISRAAGAFMRARGFRNAAG